MNMKKTLMAAVALMGGIAMAADSTYSFTYQAALRDEHGLVISNGMSVARNQTVTLRLWDAPTDGNVLWGRTYNVYTDETGLFNLEVTDTAGSRSADAPANAALESVFTNRLAGAVYIGLFVKGSSGEIVPRQRLFAVPFAAVANDVRKISGDVTVGGRIKLMEKDGKGVIISASGIEQTSADKSIFQDIKANGAVTTIGAITAGGGLAVNGGTVSIKPDVTLDSKLRVAKQATFSGGVAVSGGTLTAGGSEVVPVPVGGIIMWTKATPPDGGSWSGYKSAHWAICNGQNETPDLRGRFVVGVNNSTTGKNSVRNAYDKGDAGGTESVTLTIEQMPSHSHTLVTHSKFWRFDDGSHGCGMDQFENKQSEWNYTHTTSSAGGSKAHENRPPYYALYYIMRIN